MNREYNFRLIRIKKKIEGIVQRRNEFITDTILKNKICLAGPTELIDQISEKYGIDAQIAILENAKIGFNFKNKEIHTMYFAEKSNNLKNFIMSCDDSCSGDIDKTVGIIVYNDTIIDGFGVTIVGLKDKEFNKENIKKMLESIFPGPDTILDSMSKESMKNFTERMMLEKIVDLQRKKETNIKKRSGY